MIYVTKSSMPLYEEYCDEIKGLWESHMLTNSGVKHQELEKRLCDYLGVENTELFTNGHTALEMLLAAMDLEGEVITTPFTFASTTQAIVQNGLTPVFCDIDPVTYTIDPRKIEPLITDKTCAIVPVHVYGNICDVEAIQDIANRHGLKVIYDAAHVFGVKYKGRGIGSWGDASMFSFHATKVFNTIEGGAVVTDDGDLATKLSQIRNFGLKGLDAEYVSGNGKMNEFCAAMGLCNLRHVDSYIAARARVDASYRSLLGGVDGIRLNVVQNDVEPNYAYFPVVFDGYRKTRDQVFNELYENGIMARKYFYPLTSEFTCYKGFDYRGDTPVARHIAQNVLCLPMYADLAAEDIERICSIILA